MLCKSWQTSVAKPLSTNYWPASSYIFTRYIGTFQVYFDFHLFCLGWVFLKINQWKVFQWGPLYLQSLPNFTWNPLQNRLETSFHFNQGYIEDTSTTPSWFGNMALRSYKGMSQHWLVFMSRFSSETEWQQISLSGYVNRETSWWNIRKVCLSKYHSHQPLPSCSQSSSSSSAESNDVHLDTLSP